MIGKNGVSLLIGHNGIQDKATLSAANEVVVRGIYDATTLSTVDAELATANIKNGITIFGFAGSADVFDISDATAIAAEVIDGETFYAVSGGIRTGTMATVAITAANDNYPAGYHAGNVGGLDAIDTNLAPANIKSGVTIFGKVGTYTPTLIDDISGSAETALTAPTASSSHHRLDTSIDAYSEFDLVSKVLTYAAGSRAVAAGAATVACSVPSSIKLRLYMAAVQVAESGYIPSVSAENDFIMLVGTKALSGSQTCKLSAHNYADASRTLSLYGARELNETLGAGVAIGSIKT